MRHRAPVLLALALLAGTGTAAAILMLSAAGPGTLDERAHAVAASLKCPVCHDLSVADSPAPVAHEMRAHIREELRAGRTPDQIRAEFVAAYGDWILIAPPVTGVNLVAWFGPAAFALVALAALVLSVRRWTRASGISEAVRPLAADERRRLASAMARLDELE